MIPFTRIAWNQVHWRNSAFLMGTALLTITAVPAYLWRFGLDPVQAVLFAVFFVMTGLSITLGYHRLFAHRSFQASWPVRFATLVFGAAAFENSALCWAADHRRHHKFVDHEEDPYDITKGFFHAHIGWILFRLQSETPLETVKDLQHDRLVRWQHRHYVPIALLAGFGLPTLLGGLWGGWTGALGGFLLAGVARVVFVQHMTFFINSLCHTLGRRPYSTQCTARDSALMALVTFGEGYHNFHHAFQHDYRNGVKPWQFDPTKWAIWVLNRLGLVRQLRRVPHETIQLAEIAEQQRWLATRLQTPSVPERLRRMVENAQQSLHAAAENWEHRKTEYRLAAERRRHASQEKLTQLRREFGEARDRLVQAMNEWREVHRLAQLQLAATA